MRARLVVLTVIGVLVGGAAVGLEKAGREDQIAVPDSPGDFKTRADVRAGWRAYDGAPPVIPHEDFGMDCLDCHVDEGMAVDEVGYAPPTPHGNTPGMSEASRCRQCHVFRTTDGLFSDSRFAGLPQDLRVGRRFSGVSPPVIPHRVFMREDCVACHTGPGAREEIRTSHPERTRCQQCHAEQATTQSFTRPGY